MTCDIHTSRIALIGVCPLPTPKPGKNTKVAWTFSILHANWWGIAIMMPELHEINTKHTKNADFCN